MATIFNSVILDSAILHKTLTQTSSIWFKLIHSHLTWWWQSSWILLSSIQSFCTKKLHLIILTQLDDGSHFELCHLGFSHFAQKRTSLIHSDSTWWWQPSWILPCRIQTLPSWIQTPCHPISDSLKNTLTPLWLWLKLIEYDSNSFILTQLDDGNHLEICQLEFGHLGFSHLSFFSQTHSHLPRLVPNLFTKNFTHSFSLNLMIAAILNSAMLDSDTAILDSNTLLSSLRFTQKHSSSTLTLTQTHSFSPILMMATILYSAILDSAILHKTLNQTSSIWLKLFHSHLTWWWQPSWILPCWIQTLPTWIQISCYLFSDSLKTTLTPFWLWLKLIQYDSNSFILTQIDDGNHLEFCHVGIRHCHLGFKHLVIFSQIHSKALSFHSDSDSN